MRAVRSTNNRRSNDAGRHSMALVVIVLIGFACGDEEYSREAALHFADQMCSAYVLALHVHPDEDAAEFRSMVDACADVEERVATQLPERCVRPYLELRECETENHRVPTAP